MIIVVLLALSLVAGGWWLVRPPKTTTVRAQLLAPSATGDTGFMRVDQPLPLHFPQDEGPHPAYKTEWWYYTGNLETADGRHFGYQLTFFRSALTPVGLESSPTPSSWRSNQVYMAHFAITDVTGKQYYAFQRLSRGAAGLAGAQGAPYRVWLEDWLAKADNPGQVHLFARQEDAGRAGEIGPPEDIVELDLQLHSRKATAFHGQEGYSRKGANPGNASMYYSDTRIDTQGSIQIGTDKFAVTGSSWMDHEFGTSYLGPGSIGWDWFSLQLSDGREVMFFQIRRKDGSIDPFSSGSLVEADGTVQPLAVQDVQIAVLDNWTSPHSGGKYPARWRLSIPAYQLNLEVTPYAPDQELNLGFTYWEGASTVTDASGRLTGQGYVELTGYAESFEGRF
ncbi:MAG: carotenoid 1,2-hydratase [Chloroflexi bacterium]|nr:carotenoid 1,2-hydratase [Chloroflexota bacterium]